MPCKASEKEACLLFRAAVGNPAKILRILAEIAQLAERRLPKPKVTGSNPAFRSTMKRCTLLMILGALLLSSCSSAPIPQKQMMNLYYEMFTTDQLITESPDLRAQADSLSVYGGILERHGYTVEDYLAAVDYYLSKPESFARMMKKVQSRVNREIARMEAEQERLRAEREAAEAASVDSEVLTEDADDGAVSDTLSRDQTREQGRELSREHRPGKKEIKWD